MIEDYYDFILGYIGGFVLGGLIITVIRKWRNKRKEGQFK